MEIYKRIREKYKIGAKYNKYFNIAMLGPILFTLLLIIMVIIILYIKIY